MSAWAKLLTRSTLPMHPEFEMTENNSSTKVGARKKGCSSEYGSFQRRAPGSTRHNSRWRGGQEGRPLLPQHGMCSLFAQGTRTHTHTQSTTTKNACLCPHSELSHGCFIGDRRPGGGGVTVGGGRRSRKSPQQVVFEPAVTTGTRVPQPSSEPEPRPCWTKSLRTWGLTCRSCSRIEGAQRD